MLMAPADALLHWTFWNGLRPGAKISEVNPMQVEYPNVASTTPPPFWAKPARAAEELFFEPHRLSVIAITQ
jgi:hypothetical protein